MPFPRIVPQAPGSRGIPHWSSDRKGKAAPPIKWGAVSLKDSSPEACGYLSTLIEAC